MENNSIKYVDDLVSVIIPTFNDEKYIEKTLESVFSQTYHDIEIVLVDDCSSDNTVAIVRKYMSFHPEISLFVQPENKGAGHARNKALELARGRYVAFLDADDIWKPNKVEMQINLLTNKKGGFCFTAIEMIDGNDSLIKSKRVVRDEIDYKFLLSNTMIPTSSVLVDRSILGDFRMHLRRGGQDYSTWLNLLRGDKVAYGINEALVQYRIDGESLSSNKLKSIVQIWEIQTQDEKINKIAVVVNIVRWCWNSFKKYFM